MESIIPRYSQWVRKFIKDGITTTILLGQNLDTDITDSLDQLMVHAKILEKLVSVVLKLLMTQIVLIHAVSRFN